MAGKFIFLIKEKYLIPLKEIRFIFNLRLFELGFFCLGQN